MKTSSSPLVILNSGQTGVERGAFSAARMAGIGIAGFMRSDARDELGRIPADIARSLTPCSEAGPRRAREANVAIASAIVVAVPNTERTLYVTGMKEVLRRARVHGVPRFICDMDSDLAGIARSVIAVPPIADGYRVYVTGPRATRWEEGEVLGRNIVNAIAAAVPASISISL